MLIDKRKRGWFWDYNDLFDSSLSEHAIIVRLFLARCANKNQEAWPSLNTIARRCKISKPTAIKAVRELESQGWIRRTGRPTTSTTARSITLKTHRMLRRKPAETMKQAHRLAQRGVVKPVYQVVKRLYHLVKKRIGGW